MRIDDARIRSGSWEWCSSLVFAITVRIQMLKYYSSERSHDVVALKIITTSSLLALHKRTAVQLGAAIHRRDFTPPTVADQKC